MKTTNTTQKKIESTRIKREGLRWILFGLVIFGMVLSLMWLSYCEKQKTIKEEGSQKIAQLAKEDSIQKAQYAAEQNLVSFSSDEKEAFIEFMALMENDFFTGKRKVGFVKIWRGNIQFSLDKKIYSCDIKDTIYAFCYEELDPNNFLRKYPIILKNSAKIFNKDYFVRFSEYRIEPFKREWEFEELEPINKKYALNIQALYGTSKFLVPDYEALISCDYRADCLISWGPWILVRYFSGDTTSFFLVGQDKKIWKTRAEE